MFFFTASCKNLAGKEKRNGAEHDPMRLFPFLFSKLGSAAGSLS